ncbi:MAG: phosphatidate cytidylyltransferase [Tannerellaceae bacterium]|nr:phosphatidate cytidylyltransferase [Tannerellaceae bacterium]
MKRSDDKNRFSDVPVRIRSWLVIVLFVSVALLHPILTSLFVAVLSWQAMREYYRMNPLSSLLKLYLLYPVVLIQFYCTLTTNYLLFLFLTVVYITGYILFAGYSRTVFTGVLICVFSTAHLAFIRNIEVEIPVLNGIKFFFYLVILTELNDAFQYMTGKLFGKHKIMPRISPNKTAEGFMGGIILTTCLANGLGIWLLPQGNPLIYSLLGVGISLLGICGDLYMSDIKRKAGVKDTGNLIPGHGGLLDRIDSLTFVAPVFYLVVYAIFNSYGPAL